MLDRLFSLDNNLAETETGRQALSRGLLLAKQEALKTAERLAWLGRPLEVVVLLVSFVHVFSELSNIKPSAVGTVSIADGAFHLTAGAFTATIDCVLLYVLTSMSVGRYIGEKKGGIIARLFFYLLTGLANGIFIVASMPGLPDGFSEAVLPGMRVALAVMLTALIPTALVSIERAHRLVENVRLGLLVEVTALKELTGWKDPKAPAPAVDVAALSEDNINLAAEVERWRAQVEQLNGTVAAQLETINGWKKSTFKYGEVIEAALDRLGAQSNDSLYEKSDHLLPELDRLQDDVARLKKIIEGQEATIARQNQQIEQYRSEERPHLVEVAEEAVNFARDQVVPEAAYTCEVCGGQMTAADRGVAGRDKWQRHFEGKYACKTCRTATGL